MAVGLSEIAGIRGDAAIGAGAANANLANLPEDQFGLQLLNLAANGRMQANKYAQEQYQKNINDYLTNNLGTIDVKGIMEKDYETIIPEYANYARNVADNFEVIMNPSKNIEQYNQLKGQEAQLRGKIAQSAQQLALRKSAMDFISQHNDFQTPENIAAVQQYSTTPLENRDINAIVDLQPKYDLMQDYISKKANTVAMAKTQQENTNSPFMDKVTMTQYYKGAYDDAVKSMLQGSDGFNRPMGGVVSKAFERAPDYIKAQYTDNGTAAPNIDQFAIDQIYGPLRNQDDVSIEKTINPIYKAELEQKNQLGLIAARGAQERANLKYGKQLADDELKTAASEIPIRQLSIIETGSQSPDKAETIELQGKDAKKPNWTVPGNYGTIGGNGGSVQGFPLTLDSWLKNAYAIPTGKERVIDPITRQVVSEDQYIRPEKAWVTGDQNPNARKVILRYEDKEGPRDVVIPYAENLQLLNNVAGPTNALKMGAAKAELLKKTTGRISPSYEQLKAVPLFSNPNVESTQQPAEGNLPTPPGKGVIPTNRTTGTLNYAEWKKQQGRK
jgi:hypothetical protein